MELSSGNGKHKKTWLTFLGVSATLLILFLLARGLGIPTADSKGRESVLTINGMAQGTTWQVGVWNPDGIDLQDLQKNIEAEFERLDALLSNYRPDSRIEQFNVSTVTEPIKVGAEIVSLVQIAQGVSEATGGGYDLTIKPLFDLWGFNGDHLTPPDPATIHDVLGRIGFHRLRLIPPDQLGKDTPGLRVDLGSIAQGYSVGRIASVIEAAGISNYIVEIGGELQTSGHKPDGSPWRIGVERPLPGGRSVQKALTIKRDAPLAVMTSGTYRHYFDQQGKRYSHILDARTGRPIEHNTVSVTVVNDNPTVADAWSTALLCLGQGEGTAVADRYGIAALFITETGERLDEFTTSAWRSIKDVD